MSFARGFGIPVLGLLIVLAGVGIYAESLEIPRGFTAYAPLTSATFVPPPPTSAVVGVFAIMFGVALAAAALGYRAGVRRLASGLARRLWPLVVGVMLLALFAADVVYTTPSYAWMSVAFLALALGFISTWVGAALGRRRARGSAN